jgi:hypothetical protein
LNIIYENMHPLMKMNISRDSISSLQQLKKAVTEKERIKVEAFLVQSGYSLAEWGHIQTIEQLNKFCEDIKHNKVSKPSTSKLTTDQMLHQITNPPPSEPKQDKKPYYDNRRDNRHRRDDHRGQHHDNNSPKQEKTNPTSSTTTTDAKSNSTPSEKKETEIKDKSHSDEKSKSHGGGKSKRKHNGYDKDRKYDKPYQRYEKQNGQPSVSKFMKKRMEEYPNDCNKGKNLANFKGDITQRPLYKRFKICRMCTREGFLEWSCPYCNTEAELLTIKENYEKHRDSLKKRAEQNDNTTSSNSTSTKTEPDSDQKSNQGNSRWGATFK